MRSGQQGASFTFSRLTFINEIFFDVSDALVLVFEELAIFEVCFVLFVSRSVV